MDRVGLSSNFGSVGMRAVESFGKRLFERLDLISLMQRSKGQRNLEPAALKA